MAASVEHAWILRDLHPNIVIDVGANRGQFALLARTLFPEARVFSFDPLPHSADAFNRLFNGDEYVKFFPYAISATSGQATLHISQRNDSSSLLPIGREQTRQFPGTGEIGSMQISQRRIDQLVMPEDLKGVVLCKIDVQGYELEVLRGMGNLAERITWMVMEVSFREFYTGQPPFDFVLREAQQLGFALLRMYDVDTDKNGEVVQGNCFFGRCVEARKDS